VKRSIAYLATALLLITGLAPGQARAEATEVNFAKQYGIAYLQLMVMEDHKLVEKHAKQAGLPLERVSWNTFTGGTAVNDALLSGAVDFVGGGIGAFVTMWDRTKGNLDVKAVGALVKMPMFLNTRNPDVKSIKDLTEKDRIAVPAVKISPQAVTLQAAAAQLLGDKEFARYDSLTVNLGHPDGMQALASGSSEITAHFTTPPYQYQELRIPGVRTILNSYDVWGPQTATIVWTSSRFVNRNPKLYAASAAALEEATDWINKNKREAAELYLRMSRDKDSVDSILAMLNDPQIVFSTTPQNLMKFIDFKIKTGTMKAQPASWRDLFFPNAHGLAGG
jgi:NitT/TauT family transport system substrate-binding protein